MQTILPASYNTLKILGTPSEMQGSWRWLKYVVPLEVEDGVLLFNVLTRELLLASKEEYYNPENFPQFKQKWFRVPKDTDDMEYADGVRFINKTLHKKSKYINNYTIFTTTDCNARCFYCYELGRSRIPMSVETAKKVAEYIASHCDGHARLNWFGGEPLYNKEVIDVICKELKDRGIEYSSSMTTNGYLFDDETIEKAVSLWKITGMQITLDGTEEVYNRSKAFIYNDGRSPYQVVMGNIGKILRAGIRVNIRMNLDNHNSEDLLMLIDELHNRFAGEKGLRAYSHVLFEFAGETEKIRSDSERSEIYAKQEIIQNKLDKYGFKAVRKLRKELPVNQCMADGDNSLTVLPGGELGRCQHYSENNFVGHINREEFNQDVLKSFKECYEPIKECRECFYYPECIRLKKCEEQTMCFKETRQWRKWSILDSMKAAYVTWVKEEKAVNDVEERDEILREC